MAWLGASHDVTCLGWGEGQGWQERSEGLLPSDGHEAPAGVMQDSPTPEVSWAELIWGRSDYACLFQLPTLPRAPLRTAGGPGW